MGEYLTSLMSHSISISLFLQVLFKTVLSGVGKSTSSSNGCALLTLPYFHSIPSQYYEHHEPLMVPFNFGGFDAGFGNPAFAGSDFHQSLPIGHEQTAALHAGAETAVNNVVSNATGGASTSVVSAPGLSAYATVGE